MKNENYSMNYFELLDLDKKYNIDIALLEKQYLSKQTLYHPDRVQDVSIKREYLEKSMLLNEAYKCLKDDYLRAEYLLILSGQMVDDQALQGILSESDLEEILELYEIIDEMEQASDLKELEVKKVIEKEQMMQELANYFEENNITKALDLTVRLKYLTNLVRNIKLKIKHANS